MFSSFKLESTNRCHYGKFYACIWPHLRLVVHNEPFQTLKISFLHFLFFFIHSIVNAKINQRQREQLENLCVKSSSALASSFAQMNSPVFFGQKERQHIVTCLNGAYLLHYLSQTGSTISHL